VASRRSGFLRTNLLGEAAYWSFVPAALSASPPLELGGNAVQLLVAAHRQLAVLDGLS
jgi:hypothetical protein